MYYNLPAGMPGEDGMGGGGAAALVITLLLMVLMAMIVAEVALCLFRRTGLLYWLCVYCCGEPEDLTVDDEHKPVEVLVIGNELTGQPPKSIMKTGLSTEPLLNGAETDDKDDEAAGACVATEQVAEKSV